MTIILTLDLLTQEEIFLKFKNFPFFKKGKIGVSIVLRCKDQSKIDHCNLQILDFVKEKNIVIIKRDENV